MNAKMQVVFEVENRDFSLWNKVLNHSGLLDILLGYGRENGWFFRCFAENREEPNQKAEFFASFSFKFDESRKLVYFTSQDFFPLL